MWVAVAVVVASLWPAVLLAGRVADQERANRAVRHQVEATLTVDASPMMFSFGEFVEQWTHVTVRWPSPDGTERTGQVVVNTPMPACSTTDVWIDADGQLTEAPLDEAGARLRGIHSGVFVVLSSAAVLFFAFLCFRRALNRRRYAEWDLVREKADTRRTPSSAWPPGSLRRAGRSCSPSSFSVSWARC